MYSLPCPYDGVSKTIPRYEEGLRDSHILVLVMPVGMAMGRPNRGMSKKNDLGMLNSRLAVTQQVATRSVAPPYLSTKQAQLDFRSKAVRLTRLLPTRDSSYIPPAEWGLTKWVRASLEGTTTGSVGSQLKP